jgi:hypothetical protein
MYININPLKNSKMILFTLAGAAAGSGLVLLIAGEDDSKLFLGVVVGGAFGAGFGFKFWQDLLTDR